MIRTTGTPPPTRGSVLASLRQKLSPAIEAGLGEQGRLVPDLGRLLPTARGGHEPLPEAAFSLLLTGEIPTRDEAGEITELWRAIEGLPDYVTGTLDRMPPDTHPMTQLSIGILAMQRDSIFARRCRNGMAGHEAWEATLDDVMIVLARLPVLAAYIYRRSFRGGDHLSPADPGIDWAGNLAHMMGIDDDAFAELVRLILSIHADDDGNVGARATHLVGSTLADPYLALSAGINALAGPLQGLANQEVARWIRELDERFGGVPHAAQLESFVRETLDAGHGRPVLWTDPRSGALREFALRHLPDDPRLGVVEMLYEVVPGILEGRDATLARWPTVDARSGCLLMHYGVIEIEFHAVLFGVSRALGVLASLVWDRARHDRRVSRGRK
jgi:citrate synthase